MVGQMTVAHVGSQYQGDDFYCDVTIPSAAGLQMEHDDEWVLAFHHTKPFWDNHIVAVPKKHIASLTTATAEDEEWMRRLFVVVPGVEASPRPHPQRRTSRELESTAYAI